MLSALISDFTPLRINACLDTSATFPPKFYKIAPSGHLIVERSVQYFEEHLQGDYVEDERHVCLCMGYLQLSNISPKLRMQEIKQICNVSPFLQSILGERLELLHHEGNFESLKYDLWRSISHSMQIRTTILEWIYEWKRFKFGKITKSYDYYGAILEEIRKQSIQCQFIFIDEDVLKKYSTVIEKFRNHIIIISNYRTNRVYRNRNWSRSRNELAKFISCNKNWILIHDDSLYYDDSYFESDFPVEDGNSILQKINIKFSLFRKIETLNVCWESLADFLRLALKEIKYTINILSDDHSENGQTFDKEIMNAKPTSENLLKSHIKDFVTSHYNELTNEFEELFQSLNKESNDMKFDRYLTHDSVKLYSKELEFGALKVSEKTSKVGWIYIMSGNVTKRVVIRGLENLNRALNGDIVAVRVISSEDSTLEGKVVSVLQRNWRDYVACIQSSDLNEAKNALSATAGSNLLVVPFSKGIPKIRVQTNRGNEFANQRLVVRIADWDRKSKYPSGHIVKALGPIGDSDVEIQALIVEHNLHQSAKNFSKEALAELPASNFTIPESEFKIRKDLRKSHFVCSIDPIGCEDIDDALSVRELEDGTVEIGVHIADVTYFVRSNSSLDKEARERGSSIYFVDRRVDMLPSILSSNLCSLHEMKDRLAVSVIWKFDKDKNIKDVWFGRTIICSRHALHYKQAQNILEGKEEEPVVRNYGDRIWRESYVDKKDIPILRKRLKILSDYAEFFQNRRIEKGSITFSDPEDAIFHLDKNGIPTQISAPEDIPMHHVIEEWMVLANHYVALQICKYHPTESLLRIHPQPSQEKLLKLQLASKSAGFSLNISSAVEFSKSLREIAKTGGIVGNTIQSLARRSVEEAIYVSASSIHKDQILHYGLGLDYYSHFTSPIRRYADIIAHRVLLSSIFESNDPLLSESQVKGVSEHLNNVTRSCKQMQSQKARWVKALYFKNHPNTIAKGIIDEVFEDKLSVIVPKYKISSTIYFANKEGKLIVSPNQKGISSTSNFSTRCIDSTSVILTVEHQSYKFSVFDYVEVEVLVEESREHMPTITLLLQSFEVNKTSIFKVRNASVPQEEAINELKLDEKETLEKRFQFSCQIAPEFEIHSQPDDAIYNVLDSYNNFDKMVKLYEQDDNVEELGVHKSSISILQPTKDLQIQEKMNRLLQKRKTLENRIARDKTPVEKLITYRKRLDKVVHKLQLLQKKQSWKRNLCI